MPLSQIEKVKVNEVEVDFVALKLLINNKWHNIEARQLNLLKLLIENHGRAVSRNQIMDDLWHDTIVSDNSVSQAITQLRKSLHDDKETPRFIKTVPRVGYQLIADIELPELPEVVPAQAKKNKITNIAIAFTSALIGITLTMVLIELSKPGLQVPIYQYESRITSTPGPENFLRYSPQGRYLAFSQTNSTRSQMDLAIYDAQTQSIHTIKNTGYSEEAAEWSPNGKWLVYYRHDPISCEIRVMSVNNPVETWRLSPDFHLSYCQSDFSRQKMHWANDNTLYLQRWQNNQPILSKLTLSMADLPSVSQSEDISDISPLLMDLDKSTNQLLFVEKQQQKYALFKLDLATLDKQLIESREQAYRGLKWHESNKSFWLANENIRLMSLLGESEIVHLPMGFIPDIDLNPVTKQLAHTEGLVNVNLYSVQLKSLAKQRQLNSQQLSSSARTDILPTISKDGSQTAFISYQRRSMDGLKHIEIWLKNKYKKTASLLVNIAENIKPQYLLWSPNGENLLLGGSNNDLYLINIFSKHMVPIITDYHDIDKINWSTDGKLITFDAKSGNKKQAWQYDLQLNNTQLIDEININEARVSNESIPLLSMAHIKTINPSYRHYIEYTAQFLTRNLEDQLPVENIYPSLALYRPMIFSLGIYYVVKQGHLLTLYLYQFDDQQNIAIANIGNHEQDISLLLNISASDDGKNLVYSKVEGLETDILLQKKVSKIE